MPVLPPRTATVSTDPTLVNHLSSKPEAPVDAGPTPPYQLTVEQVATEYEVDREAGLTDSQAQERLQRYGPNELEGGDGVSWVRVLLAQVGAYKPHATCTGVITTESLCSQCYGPCDDRGVRGVAGHPVLD